MRSFLIATILVVVISAINAECDHLEFTDNLLEATLMYNFGRTKFVFENESDFNHYWDNEYYKNVTIAGIKVSLGEESERGGRIFVSCPRWVGYVPSTLNEVIGSDILRPYPSLKDNEIGDPDALQSVLGFEIDYQNQLWVLDQGRVNNVPIDGGMKVVVFDIKTDTRVATYPFSQPVVYQDTTFLNDIVLDIAREMAYITDSGLPIDPISNPHTRGGLIVLDFGKNSSRRILDNQDVTNANESLSFSINNEVVISTGNMMTGADGIALNLKDQYLVWCPLTSTKLYKIDLTYLIDDTLSDLELLNYVEVLMDRHFTSDGLAFDKSGNLYISALGPQVGFNVTAHGGIWPENGVFRLLRGSEELEQISKDTAMKWPDTFAFDDKGNLLFVANQLNRYLESVIAYNEDETASRIWKINVSEHSYLHNTYPPTAIHHPQWYLVTIGFAIIWLSFVAFFGVWVVGVLWTYSWKFYKKSHSL